MSEVVIKAPLTPKSDTAPYVVKLKVYWKTTKKWSASDIHNFQSQAAKIAEQLRNSGRKFTCEDFCIGVLCEFASKNGLPVKLIDGVRTYRNMEVYDPSYHEVYEATARGFSDMVMKSFGAADTQNPVNTTSVTSEINLLPGDILAQANDAEGKVLGRAHHIQMVSSISSNSIEIFQVTSDGIRSPIVAIWNRITSHNINNPRDSEYGGMRPERGIFAKNRNSSWDYKNIDSKNSKKDFLKEFKFYRWNFQEFNK